MQKEKGERKVNKKPVFALFALLMLLIVAFPIVPVKSWNYTDGTPKDTKFEKFGPRADKLLIKLYANAEAEWDALEAGEIDITDWPLTEAYLDRFNTPPQNDSIDTQYYSSEFGLFLIDLNWNNNTYLDNPPNPDYPNPAYPNPTSVLEMRQAIWHLRDSATWLPTIIGSGMYFPLETTVPPCFGAASLPMANPYPYSRAAAAAKLDAGGFPWEDLNSNGIMDPGERYWDMNKNGVHDAGEDLELTFWIRTDHSHRHAVGDNLADELNAVGVAVNRQYGPVMFAVIHWFYGKEGNMYTAGWGLGADPDHVILWNSYFYWHPGFCYNTGFVNDPTLDTTSWGVYLANTMDEAISNAHAFQVRFAEVAAAIPLWSYAGTKAVRRRYTGGTNEVLQSPDDGENAYRGNYWDGIVNVTGYGLDSYFSFLNMHPRGHEYGSGDMTIRWAYKTTELKSFNPVYAEWLWEWNTLGLVYDSLLMRNPYNLAEYMPWIALNFSTSTYEHPIYGTCTKVVFTLRPDVYWADGMPLTTADVYFTFVELDDILAAQGLPPPWWYSSVADILSFSILDPYNFEVLFDVKSVFATMWVGGNVILPKHIWKPLAEAGPGVVDDPAADPNMIGSGPWRFQEYVGFSHVLMVANKPGSTVTTSHAGSTAVTSTMGFHHWDSVNVISRVIAPIPNRNKIPPGSEGGEASVVFAIHPKKWIPPYVDVYQNATITHDTGVDTYADTYEGQFATCATTVLDSLTLLKQDLAEMVKTTIVKKTTNMIELKWTITLQKVDWVDVNIDGVTYSYDDKNSITIEIWWRIIGVERATIIRDPKMVIYPTIKEDIAGSTLYDDIDLGTYPHKTELPSPDFKVDIKDIALAAKAFGAYPGHERWNTVADINLDYKIDIKDIAGIAKQFGWVGGLKSLYP